MSQIQWFPGHMAKTLRELKENINLCDCIIEVCDARMPESSRNPQLNELIQHKRRLLLLNKEDLADPAETAAWLSFYKATGMAVISGNAIEKKSIRAVQESVLNMNRDIIERAKARGRMTRPIRTLVAGIPNCGKSTLINGLVGRKKAETSDRPGVTRALSWLKSGTDLQLLDSPGLLWPKLETRHEQIVLGACAAIKDDIMPLQDLAGELILLIAERYPATAAEKFQLSLSDFKQEDSRLEIGRQCLQHTARIRSILKQGGELDLQRCARQVLTGFREGTLGRLSLESPPPYKQNAAGN